MSERPTLWNIPSRSGSTIAAGAALNLEPQPTYFSRLAEQRPRDLNLNAGLSDTSGDLTLYQAEGYPGWATMEEAVAEDFRQRGMTVSPISVPVSTLKEICERHVSGTIDFLKIDVEGFEEQVLRGADFTRWRPRVMVIEATAVGSPQSNYKGWEPLVFASSYLFAAFDGLNRYYVRSEDAQLAEILRIPPNVFDNYITHELAEARMELTRLRAELHALRSQGTDITCAKAEAEHFSNPLPQRDGRILVPASDPGGQPLRGQEIHADFRLGFAILQSLEQAGLHIVDRVTQAAQFRFEIPIGEAELAKCVRIRLEVDDRRAAPAE